MDEARLRWLLEETLELVRRVERISADSCVAHASSGIRGELWRMIDRMEKALRGKARFDDQHQSQLADLMAAAHQMLVEAAREIPYDEKQNQASPPPSPFR